MATRKRKSAKRKIGALAAKHKVTRRMGRIRRLALRRRKSTRGHISRATPVVFAKTSTKRIRFKLPTGKWSRSYANRGAARRGARRIYKSRIVAQKVAA